MSSLAAALPGAQALAQPRPVALSFRGVTHRYGPRIALDRLDLEVAPG